MNDDNWDKNFQFWIAMVESGERLASRWDTPQAVAFWELIRRTTARRSGSFACRDYKSQLRALLKDPEPEFWDDDLFPPRSLFVAAMMLAMVAVQKTADDKDVAEAVREWSMAAEFLAMYIRGEEGGAE